MMEFHRTAHHTERKSVHGCLLVTVALVLQLTNAAAGQHDTTQNPRDSILEITSLKNRTVPNVSPQRRRIPRRSADGRADPCVPFNKTLTEVTQGVIEWVEDVMTCPQSAMWILKPPPDYGLVLGFWKVLTTHTSLLTVTWNCSQCHLNNWNESTDSESLYTSQRVFNRTKYEEYDRSPFLVRGEVVINITTENSKRVDHQLSSLTISYSAHPLQDMPEVIADSLLTNYSIFQQGLVSSKTLYNCSTVIPSSKMPAMLWCDGITHCVGGEDEWSMGEDGVYSCTYRDQYCDQQYSIDTRRFTTNDIVINPVPYSHNQCIGMVVVKSVQTSASVTTVLDVNRFASGWRFGLGDVSDRKSFNWMWHMAAKSGATSSLIALRNSPDTYTLKENRLQHLYRFVWHQSNGNGNPVVYRYPSMPKRWFGEGCAILVWVPAPHLKPVSCSDNVSVDSIFIALPSGRVEFPPTPVLNIPATESQVDETKFVTRTCSDGSFVHIFHPCPHLLFTNEAAAIKIVSPAGFPLFHCKYGPPVHYTVVCDGVRDCVGGSDEKECKFTWMSHGYYYTCKNIIQHFNYKSPRGDIRCDGIPDCLDGSDEENCVTCNNDKIMCPGLGCFPKDYHLYFKECAHSQNASEGQNAASGLKSSDVRTEHSCTSEVNGTGVVRLDGYGMSCLSPVTNQTNMEGLVYCSVGDFYIPSYMVSNGVRDCYRGEDEISAYGITCPGYYRCHETGNCLHPELVCDGIVHCPNRDDELYCCTEYSVHCNCPKSPNFPCCSKPPCCNCEGWACVCYPMTSQETMVEVDAVGYSGVRLLSISGSVPKRYIRNTYTGSFDLLQVLNISSCNLSYVYLNSLMSLKILDLSFNHLNNISRVSLYLSGLTHLYLSGNPLAKQLKSMTGILIGLRSLIIQDIGLQRIETGVFRHFKQISNLDIRKNIFRDYTERVFEDLAQLAVLYTDDYKLCCPVFHNNREIECHAPKDELSSCRDLLRSDVLRIFLWIVALLALLGNGGVLVHRAYTYKHKAALTFRILVTNLCASDLLMGAYMLMIGVADTMFRGSYVGQEREWRASNMCTAAGFLALLSSEVSALVVCFITLDRVLLICFPFKTTIHLTHRQTSFLCLGAWILGLVLAASPLVAQLQFYGETAICLPLPITRRQFNGQAYSFAVFIVLNFALFLFIGAGQVAIFRSIRVSGRGAGKSSERRQQDLAIARRLFTIVLTDFLCWFPIGLMGLLAYVGDVPISGEVNVVAAIFVLPVNSALNPFLYTLNGLLQSWAKKRALNKTRKLLANIHAEIPKLNQDVIEDIALISLKGCKKEALEKITTASLKESDIHAMETIMQTLFRTRSQTDKQRLQRALSVIEQGDDDTLETDVTGERRAPELRRMEKRRSTITSSIPELDNDVISEIDVMHDITVERRDGMQMEDREGTTMPSIAELDNDVFIKDGVTSNVTSNRRRGIKMEESGSTTMPIAELDNDVILKNNVICRL